LKWRGVGSVERRQTEDSTTSANKTDGQTQPRESPSMERRIYRNGGKLKSPKAIIKIKASKLKQTNHVR